MIGTAVRSAVRISHPARDGRGAISASTVIAAILLLTPMTAVAQVPGGPGAAPPPPSPPPPPQGPFPPAPPDPPPLTAPGQVPDPPASAPLLPIGGSPVPSQLTKVYRGNDGSALYLTGLSSTVVGFAEHPGRHYAFVFRGTRTKNVINGSWYDVAKGTRATVGVGAIQLKVFKSGDRLVRSSVKDFGPDVFTAIDPRKIAWPGAREAGFQARSRSDLDGAFVGKTPGLALDGSRLYWREAPSFGAIGVAEGPRLLGSTRPAWVSVFFGKRNALGKVSGDFFDVPKGTEAKHGTFLIFPFAQRYGRRYGLQQWGPDHVGLGDRGGVIDADYAMNFDKVAAALDAYFRDHVVGFGYAVSRNGKVVRSDGGGSAYLSKTKKGFDVNQPFASGTRTDIGSSSKLIVATAVMQELGRRGMSVDEPAAPYLPDCWDLSQGVSALTFRQLLTHKTGIQRPSKALLTQDPTGYLFQKAVAETELTGPVKYDNQNYVLLGWILAGMVDKLGVEASFAEHGCAGGTPAMGETMQIFETRVVVGMLRHEGVGGGWKWSTGPNAYLYDFKDQSKSGPLSAQNINPSGGLKMTPDELGEFMAKLEAGRFVKPSTVQAMKDGVIGFDGALDGSPPGGGLGWMLTKNGSAKEGGRGAGSQVAMMPGGVQVIAVWNSINNTVSGKVPIALRKAWESGIK
jgi:hypothetical protein